MNKSKKGIIFMAMTLIFSMSFFMFANAGVGDQVSNIFKTQILGEVQTIVDNVVFPILIVILLVLLAIGIGKMAFDHHNGRPLNYWLLIGTIICLISVVVLGGGAIWDLVSTSSENIVPPSQTVAPVNAIAHIKSLF